MRTLTNMCSVPLDLFSMLELGGQQPSSAMISMNQLTTGHHLANRRAARKKTTGIPNPKRMFEEVLSLFLVLFDNESLLKLRPSWIVLEIDKSRSI